MEKIFEVEKKATIFEIELLENLVQNLFKIEKQEKSIKKDIYFSESPIQKYEDIRKQKTIFRVRQNNKDLYLTLKSKRLVHHTEVNDELEVLLTQTHKEKIDYFFQQIGRSLTENDYNKLFNCRIRQDWIHFFEDFGFYFLLAKEKQSTIYSIIEEGLPVSIELNHIVDLGDFIEIEILCHRIEETQNAIETIDNIFQKLKIPKDCEESRLYLELLFLKQHQN